VFGPGSTGSGEVVQGFGSVKPGTGGHLIADCPASTCAGNGIQAIAGKWHTGSRRVSCEAVNGLGRKPKTGAQAKQGQRRAGIVRHPGTTTVA
jgi:hypothetical protein